VALPSPPARVELERVTGVELRGMRPSKFGQLELQGVSLAVTELGPLRFPAYPLPADVGRKLVLPAEYRADDQDREVSVNTTIVMVSRVPNRRGARWLARCVRLQRSALRGQDSH
jgi:hypothetical protein